MPQYRGSKPTVLKSEEPEFRVQKMERVEGGQNTKALRENSEDRQNTMHLTEQCSVHAHKQTIGAWEPQRDEIKQPNPQSPHRARSLSYAQLPEQKTSQHAQP